MIKELCDTIKLHVNNWHEKGLTWFELEAKEDNLSELVVRCAYHNYCIWHFIEQYKNPDTGLVLFVYDGGLEHNKYRNAVIEKMDEEFSKYQKFTGKNNSETLGSILDRISTSVIKAAHLKDSGDQRLEKVLHQTNTLVKCAEELFEDICSGHRQYEIMSRFKTSGYN